MNRLVVRISAHTFTHSTSARMPPRHCWRGRSLSCRNPDAKKMAKWLLGVGPRRFCALAASALESALGVYFHWIGSRERKSMDGRQWSDSCKLPQFIYSGVNNGTGD